MRIGLTAVGLIFVSYESASYETKVLRAMMRISVSCGEWPYRCSHRKRYSHFPEREGTQIRIKDISGNDIKICRVMQKKPHGKARHIFIECYYNKKRHAVSAR